MLDLHTHTNESDGSLSPAELVETALRANLRALAITDHDTFQGYIAARDAAKAAGLDLVCGIEVSSRDDRKGIHVLGYFLTTDPPPDFLAWLNSFVTRRSERNRALAARLRELGLAVDVEEAEALGRTVTGRVHFARVLMSKGFTRSIQEAFDRYLGEGGQAYIEVHDPPASEAVARLRSAGALPVLAHPARYGIHNVERETTFIERLIAAGLAGLEVIHSDHEPQDVARYSRLAERYGLLTTGGSDYHGDVKPHVRLGHGNNGQLPIPPEWLDRMRAAVPAS